MDSLQYLDNLDWNKADWKGVVQRNSIENAIDALESGDFVKENIVETYSELAEQDTEVDGNSIYYNLSSSSGSVEKWREDIQNLNPGSNSILVGYNAGHGITTAFQDMIDGLNSPILEVNFDSTTSSHEEDIIENAVYDSAERLSSLDDESAESMAVGVFAAYMSNE